VQTFGSVTTDNLVLTARDGVKLNTTVDVVTADVTGTGGLTLNETDGVTLERLTVHDGAVLVTARGVVIVGELVVQTDAVGNDVRITNTAVNSDVLIGLVQVGSTHGRITLDSGRDLREIDDTDPAYDVIADYAELRARHELGSRANPDLNLEVSANQLVTVDG